MPECEFCGASGENCTDLEACRLRAKLRLASQVKMYSDAIEGWRHKVAELEKERDAAAEELATLRGLDGPDLEGCRKCAELEKRLYALDDDADLDALEREYKAQRDEARKKLSEVEKREAFVRDEFKRAIRLLEIIKRKDPAWNEGDDGDMARFREAVKKGSGP